MVVGLLALLLCLMQRMCLIALFLLIVQLVLLCFLGVARLIAIVSVNYDGGYACNCVELLLRVVVCFLFCIVLVSFFLLLSLENIRVLVSIGVVVACGFFLLRPLLV